MSNRARSILQCVSCQFSHFVTCQQELNLLWEPFQGSTTSGGTSTYWIHRTNTATISNHHCYNGSTICKRQLTNELMTTQRGCGLRWLGVGLHKMKNFHAHSRKQNKPNQPNNLTNHNLNHSLSQKCIWIAISKSKVSSHFTVEKHTGRYRDLNRPACRCLASLKPLKLLSNPFLWYSHRQTNTTNLISCDQLKI